MAFATTKIDLDTMAESDKEESNPFLVNKGEVQYESWAIRFILKKIGGAMKEGLFAELLEMNDIEGVETQKGK